MHPKAINFKFVWLCYSSLFLLGLADNIRGPLFPDVMKNLDLSDFQGSSLWGIASAFAFLGCLLTPWLLRKTNLRISFLISMFLMLLGQWFAAFAIHYGFAAVGSVSLGLSFGFLGVLQNALILRSGPADRIQSLQAGLHSQYALASLLAPLMLSSVALFLPGWRIGALAGALITSIGFVFLLWSSRGLQDTGPAPRPPEMKRHSPRSLLVRAIWVGCVLGFYVIVEIMASSRLALLLQREMNFQFEEASLATTLFFVGLLVGRVLFIFWQPQKSLRIQLVLSHALTLIFLILGLVHDPRWVILTGLSMAPFYPLAMAYIGSRFHGDEIPQVAAVALSINSFLTVIMHLGVGALTEQFGILRAIWLGPFAIAISLSFLLSDNWLFRKLGTQ